MVVKGKGKVGYLNGVTHMPSTDDPTYVGWKAQNLMVMAWLIFSMEDHLFNTNILFPTAKKIQDLVALTYSDLENTSQMFEIRNEARNF